MTTPHKKGQREEAPQEENGERRVWTCPFKDCNTCYRHKDTQKLGTMIRNHLVYRHFDEATEKVKENLAWRKVLVPSLTQTRTNLALTDLLRPVETTATLPSEMKC